MILESKAMPPLLPEEFFLEKHMTIWRAMGELYDSDGAFDLMSLAGHLKATGKLEQAGGAAILGACVEEGVMAHQVIPMARMIRAHGRQRQIIRLGADLIARGYDGKVSETEIARRIEELPGPLTSALYDAALNWFRLMERWNEKRILSGYVGLDNMTQGHGLGELILIGGRASHGKTAFACNLARRLAGLGTEVDYLTLEETDDAITRRWISQISGVDNFKLKTGALSPSEFQAAEAAVKEIQGLPLICTTLETINSLDEDAVIGMVARSKAQVIFVDHAQKVQTKNDSRVYGLQSFLDRLHAVAIRNKKVVVVLWQLSRTMETEHRPPRLSDLRDSGAAEMAPRQVLLLYWPWKFAPDDNPIAYYRVDVAKNSDAGTGLVEMAFEPGAGRFSDAAHGGGAEPF